MKYFIATLILAVGIYFVMRTESMLHMFGRVDWAEENMQLMGGTRMFYKLLGIIAIIGGLLVITGLGEGLASAILLPLFGVH